VREAARAVQLKQRAQDGSRTAAVPDAVVVGAQEMAGGAGGGGEAGVKGLRKTLRHMSQTHARDHIPQTCLSVLQALQLDGGNQQAAQRCGEPLGLFHG